MVAVGHSIACAQSSGDTTFDGCLMCDRILADRAAKVADGPKAVRMVLTTNEVLALNRALDAAVADYEGYPADARAAWKESGGIDAFYRVRGKIGEAAGKIRRQRNARKENK